MGMVSNKHVNARREFYGSFDGGLNLSVPNESVAKNELKEALNVEFSPQSGAMRVRGGLVWSGRFEGDVDFVLPVPGRGGFLVRLKGTRRLLYFRWNSIWTVDGELSGTGDLSGATWGGSGDMVIASGGKLQRFSDKGLPVLETLEGSPNDSRLVFVRNGRVGVLSGPDTLKFSHVGDCELWENVADDESSGQYVEVGYKDGMDIRAIMPLSRDLIIFKSPEGELDKGIIWRLSGEYPDWVLYEVAHNTGTFSQRSVQAVGNDVFYVTVSGVASLSSVTSYGEIKTGWPDRKVSNALTRQIDDSAQLWDVAVKQQLWVLPSKGAGEIWVMDYARGLWTKMKYPKELIYATGVDKLLYVFMGRDLYEVNEDYTQDELKDEGKQEIVAELRLGTLLTGHQTLIKGLFASFDIKPECRAELWLGKFKMPFSYGGEIDYIYDAPNDTQYASEDDDPLFPEGGVLTSRRRCLVRDWAITPEIKIYGGGCAISSMGLEIVEV